MNCTCVLIALAVLGQIPAKKYLPPLNKSETKRMVREAEKQLHNYLKTNPVPRSDRQAGSKEAKSVLREHRGNPLAGRICEFRCRFEYVTLATDMIPKETDPSEFVDLAPIRPEHAYDEDSKILHASISSSLKRLYRAGGRTTKADDKAFGALRHRLQLQVLPKDTLPEIVPRSFAATVKVRSVEWDIRQRHPTFIIHGLLLVSEKLDIRAGDKDP